jgi:hypothetical protein
MAWRLLLSGPRRFSILVVASGDPDGDNEIEEVESGQEETRDQDVEQFLRKERLTWDPVIGAYKWAPGLLNVSLHLLHLRYPDAVFEDKDGDGSGSTFVYADAVKATYDRVRARAKAKKPRRKSTRKKANQQGDCKDYDHNNQQ